MTTANTQPIFPVSPKFATVAIANADAQNQKTIYTAGSNGGRVAKLALVSNDTADHDIGVYVNGALIGTVACAAGAGNSSTVPGHDILSDPNFKHSYQDANGNFVLDLPAGAVLAISSVVTVTSGKTVIGNVSAGDF